MSNEKPINGSSKGGGSHTCSRCGQPKNNNDNDSPLNPGNHICGGGTQFGSSDAYAARINSEFSALANKNSGETSGGRTMVIGGEKVESGSGGRSGKNGNKNPPAALSAKTGRGNSTTNNPSDYRDQGLPNAPSAIKPPGAGQRNTLDDLLTFGLPLWDYYWGKLEKLLEWAKGTPLDGSTQKLFTRVSIFSFAASIAAILYQFSKEGVNFKNVSKAIISVTLGVLGILSGGAPVALVAGVVWTILDVTGVADWALAKIEPLAKALYDGFVNTISNIQWSYTEFLNNLRKAAGTY
ncbi:MAG TPA: hypothetical protein PLW09_09685 [Candidatus Kapabacteria bacterium]|nr:hypothetical protein [Candidatus Kapabacteria bacterium]